MSSLGLEFIVLGHVALLPSPGMDEEADDEDDEDNESAAAQCDWRDATMVAATCAGGRGS